MPPAQKGTLESFAERSRRRPPERFHVFLSYTTREDETRKLKPVVEYFLEHMLRPLIESTIGEPRSFTMAILSIGSAAFRNGRIASWKAF